MDKVGKDGVITVEEGKSLETDVDSSRACSSTRATSAPLRHRPDRHGGRPRGSPTSSSTRRRSRSAKDLLPLLEQVAEGGKPLLIIAEDIEGEALATLVVNKLRGVLKVAPSRPRASATAARPCSRTSRSSPAAPPIAEDLGIDLEKLELNELGRPRRSSSTRTTPPIIEGAGKKKDIQGRIEQIRAQIEATTSDYDREKLRSASPSSPAAWPRSTSAPRPRSR
jgi:chaperonin GroEL